MDFGAASAGRVLESHRACGVDIASRQRFPRDQFIVDFVDDFRGPFDIGTGWAVGDPVRPSIVADFDILEMLHEQRQVFELPPERVDLLAWAANRDGGTYPYAGLIGYCRVGGRRSD